MSKLTKKQERRLTILREVGAAITLDHDQPEAEAISILDWVENGKARPDLAVPTIAGATPEKLAEEESSRPVGEDPGDREVLTQWAEAIRQQDATREAAREAAALESEPEVGETNNSAGAKDWVLREGVRVGCPECSAEADRRRERDESLKRGHRKLASRINLRGRLRTGPLDEDELLAVAGSEVYPPNDEEPSPELTIRNRMGEIFTHDRDGWTAMPGNPWALHYAWTSLEMSRRGPWHVV